MPIRNETACLVLEKICLFGQCFVNNSGKRRLTHKLRIKYYLRYCDDFVILGRNKERIENLIYEIDNFIRGKLKLTLHSDKIIIRKYHQGIDFLGYVVLPNYRVLRTKTRRRIFKKIIKRRSDLETGLISEKSFNQSLQSYLGVLKHCSGYKIVKKLEGLV